MIAVFISTKFNRSEEMPYEDTNVSVSNSQGQITRLLRKHSITAIRFTSFIAYDVLECTRDNLAFRMEVHPKLKQQVTSRQIEQAQRQAWRAMYWYMKAKLEAVEFGIHEFNTEFLPHMMLTDAQGQSNTVSSMLFAHLEGRLAQSSDPFGGLRVLPPPAEQS